MIRRRILPLVFFIAFVSACSGFELSPQPQAGEGWEFLAWAPVDTLGPGGLAATIGPTEAVFLTTQAELDELARTLQPESASAEDLERVSEARTPHLSVDFDNEVVLAVGSDATGNCGGPVYLDIAFTDTQVVMDPFRVPEGTACTSDARRSVSLFALDREMLPDGTFGVVVAPSQTATVIEDIDTSQVTSVEELAEWAFAHNTAGIDNRPSSFGVIAVSDETSAPLSGTEVEIRINTDGENSDVLLYVGNDPCENQFAIGLIVPFSPTEFLFRDGGRPSIGPPREFTMAEPLCDVPLPTDFFDLLGGRFALTRGDGAITFVSTELDREFTFITR